MDKASNKIKQSNKEKGVGVNGNLRPAKKGEVRNPAGRPKKELCIPDILNRILNEQSIYSADKKTNLEVICEKAVDLAQGGDRDARNWVSDRAEGKAIERIMKQKVYDEIVINPAKKDE